MIDANTYYMDAYHNKLAQEELDQEALARREGEIYLELFTQCGTLEGALLVVSEMDTPDLVLAGFLAGTATLYSALKTLAVKKAREAAPNNED